MVIFKFNFLALIVSEISWGPIFTLGGPARFARHLAENFCTRSEYFTTSNCVVNFNFLAPVVSESQIYINGPCAPRTPPSGNIFDTPQILAYTYIAYTYIRISNGAIFNDLERPLTQITQIFNVEYDINGTKQTQCLRRQWISSKTFCPTHRCNFE